MPLQDHFHPPLSLQRPWAGIHSAWAAAIATQLNRDLLPPDYFAMPQITAGVRIEADVSTWKESASSGGGNGAVAVQTWAPPQPTLSAAVDFVELQAFEVQVMQELGGPRLAAAIELVSPGNKDRPSHRQAFAVKCAAYLQRGVALIVVDVVTDRNANLHAQLLEILQTPSLLSWQSSTDISAIAYRAVPWQQGDRVDVWPHTLAIGTELPTLPLWLDDALCVPLALEQSYISVCNSLRVRAG